MAGGTAGLKASGESMLKWLGLHRGISLTQCGDGVLGGRGWGWGSGWLWAPLLLLSLHAGKLPEDQSVPSSVLEAHLVDGFSFSTYMTKSFVSKVIFLLPFQSICFFLFPSLVCWERLSWVVSDFVNIFLYLLIWSYVSCPYFSLMWLNALTNIQRWTGFAFLGCDPPGHGPLPFLQLVGFDSVSKGFFFLLKYSGFIISSFQVNSILIQ